VHLDDLQRLAATKSHHLNRRQLLILGGAAVFVAGCGSGGKDTKTTGARPNLSGFVPGGGKEVAEVNWGLVGDAVSLDPLQAYDYQSVQPAFQAMDSILALNTKNEIVPMLAESWKQMDPLTYVYNIRSGVTFQDGSPLTAKDVAYSLNRHLDPKNESFLISFMGSVKEVTSNGNNQVIVKLKQPDANWKFVPTIPVGLVVSQKNIEALQKAGKTVGAPDALPLGSGPYKLVKWTKGQSVQLTRYDGYWNKAKPLKVKNLNFQVVSDAEAMANGLINGELQGTFQLNGRAVQPLKSRIQVLSSQSVNIRLLGFNCKKKPFDDPRVRQALSLAIDKPGLLKSAYGGEGQLWNSPIEQNQWGFSRGIFQSAYNALPDYMTRDLAKAKSLIDASGAKGQKGNIIAATPEQQAQAVAVQAAGRQLGLDLSIDKVPSEQQIALMFPADDKPREYSLTMYDWGSDTPDPSGNLIVPFLSTNPSVNFMQYDNPELDKILNTQIKMPDNAARANMIAQAQKIAVDAQAWSVLYWINNLTLLAKNLGGLRVIPTYPYWSWAADLSGK
jgi:peptide/nickel transport system substrate-binding protein